MSKKTDRDEYVAFVVSKDEKKSLKTEAGKMGMTMSCYIRYILFIKPKNEC